jgi:hypothetical protein
MAFNASLNTSAAANTQIIIEFYNISTTIAANLDWANSYALMAIGAIFFPYTYYFD